MTTPATPIEVSAPTPGYDALTLRAALTWPNWLAASVLSLLLGHRLGTPAAAAYLGGHTRAAQALLLTWPLSYGLGVAAGERFARQASLAPVRVVTLLHGLCLFALLGALSRRDLDATWALLLLAAPCWGELFPFNRVVAGGLVVVPVVLRLALADAPSSPSLLAAAALGAAASLGHTLVSAALIRQRTSDDGALAATTLGADTLDEAGALVTAMRLHDTLSGAVSLARVRAADDGDVTAVARRLAAHIRDACATLAGFDPARCADDVRAALAAAAPALGLEVEVTATGCRSVDGAWREVRDLLVEVLANEARHGAARRITVALSERGGRAVAAVATSLPAGVTDPSRRGLRNLARRVSARGGHLTLPTPDDPRVTIELPLADRASWRDALRIAGLAAVYAAPPALVWRQTALASSTAAVAAASAFLGLVQWRNGARVRSAVEARRRSLGALVDAAARPAVETAVARLAPAADALDAAALGRDDRATRAAIDGAAGALDDLLGAFEAGRAAAVSGAAGPGAQRPAPPRPGSSPAA